MFTGIITDVGRIVAVEQRGDLRAADRLRLRHRGRRARRLDRLLGRLPDRGRQGRGLVRGRRLGARPRAAPRPACWTEGARLNLERALKARRRAWRPYRHRPCRRGRRGRRGRAERRFDSGSASSRAGRARALYRRQGLDRARRRLADRQRGREPRRRRRRVRRQHHPAYRARRPASARSRAGRRVNIEIDVLARYLGRMLEARASTM